MDRVFNCHERPFSDVSSVAVAITSIDDDQRHIGILHKNEDSGEIKILHHAFHYVLINSDPRDYYAWVAPNIHQARLQNVAAKCRDILRENPEGIPYSFSPPQDCFDPETGAYLLGPNNIGLTCASFVLAVFQSVGLRLVTDDNWPTSRPDDDKFREKVIEMLRKSLPPVPEEHITAIAAQQNLPRYRPEEVAAAAASDPLPTQFESANKLALEILEKLKADGLRKSP